MAEISSTTDNEIKGSKTNPEIKEDGHHQPSSTISSEEKELSENSNLSKCNETESQRGKEEFQEAEVKKEIEEKVTVNNEQEEDDTNIEEGIEKYEGVVYHLRDRNIKMVQAWNEIFKHYVDQGGVKISHGDIFRNAPAADALVSPANSFGFMDGGIDMAYSLHFGWQLQKRLQKVIREEKHGEILVGDAVILPTFEGGATEESIDWSGSNEGQPIKWLASAPTMRVPMEVVGTVNAYLAFRAVILAVQAHNADNTKEKIRSVLMPGLGTAVGRLPPHVCAKQMLMAYLTYELRALNSKISPQNLGEVYEDHFYMADL